MSDPLLVQQIRRGKGDMAPLFIPILPYKERTLVLYGPVCQLFWPRDTKFGAASGKTFVIRNATQETFASITPADRINYKVILYHPI